MADNNVRVSMKVNTRATRDHLSDCPASRSDKESRSLFTVPARCRDARRRQDAGPKSGSNPPAGGARVPQEERRPGSRRRSPDGPLTKASWQNDT